MSAPVDEPTDRLSLRRLLDREAIRELLAQYNYCIDRHAWEPSLKAVWVDCFTDDVVYTVTHGRDQGEMHGREALKDWIADRLNDPPLHQHLLSEPYIVTDGDSGCVRTDFIRAQDGGEAGAKVTTFGTYIDTVRRCSDGRWRIDSRIVRIDYGV